MKYIATAITKDNYWVLLSKPCTKDEAEMFRGCEMRGEKFEVKTEDEVSNHKKVLRQDIYFNSYSPEIKN